MKSKDLHPRLLYPAKLSFRMEGQIKCFLDKVKLKEFIITKPSLCEMLKGLLKEVEQEKGTEVRESNVKYLPMNNHFKCKWLKCSNQKS